jgi:hypothetical protein
MFDTAAPVACGCVGIASNADWTLAAFMPVLDHELKCITAVPFDADHFQRLAILQAEIQRLRW